METFYIQTKKTAAECYAEQYAECQDLLKKIANRLEQHKQDQGQESDNWGCVGAIGHVNTELADILGFLGDRVSKSVNIKLS